MLMVKANCLQNPEGRELIEPTLRELQAKMREAYQKSRYVFDLYYRRKEISMELYEFSLDQGYTVQNLIAKGKKPGYECLCCLRCMQPHDHNFQMT